MIIVNFIYPLRTELNLGLDVEERKIFSAADPIENIYWTYDFQRIQKIISNYEDKKW